MKDKLKKAWRFCQKAPTALDAALLCVFTALVTFQPYWFEHEIIMMETGIHLPAVNALFHGLVPYRDFFFLRGPLELYVPAAMISFFQMNMIALPLFYYTGTVLTLWLCVFLAQQLFRTRFILYLFVPVFIARTFPRIAYYYWGGMRYAVGFLALLFLFLMLKSGKRRWALATGFSCGLAFLTSVETGVAVIPAVGAGLIFAYAAKTFDRGSFLRMLRNILLGFLILLGPYFLYLLCTRSLFPFLQSVYAVVCFNGVAFPGEYGVKPETLLDYIAAFWPSSRYFKFMTPVFCYLAFAGYLWRCFRRHKLREAHVFLVAAAVYGLVLYMAAFRKIEGHHFEMALQVEKLFLFFLIEELLFFLWQVKERVSFSFGKMTLGFSPGQVRWAAVLFAVVLFKSSLSYSLVRYSHRFPAYKLLERSVLKKPVDGLSFLEGQETRVLSIERAKGLVAPAWQEEEIRGVTEFLKSHTRPDEAIFSYPEVGNFSFFADRPFIGRFPIATFTWMYEPWHRELLSDFNAVKPRYVVMTHLGHRTFPALWYFRNADNIRRFHEFTNLILANYRLVKSFATVGIYERKPPL